jgi:two-component system response regulator
MQHDTIEVLLADDDLGDVDLTIEAITETKEPLHLNVVHDGVEAMAYLRREGAHRHAERPDLIFLDLNMPKKDGREVLRELKADPLLCCIPVVVLTTSDSETDIETAYRLGASCYITKPVGLERFIHVVRCIMNFWFTIVQLPCRGT